MSEQLIPNENHRHAPNVSFVIFGASGDLTSRKILPALCNLAKDGSIGKTFSLVGIARTPLDDDGFRKLIKNAVKESNPAFDEIISRARYVNGEYTDQASFAKLKTILDETAQISLGNVTYYLATVPEMFGEVALELAKAGLSKPSGDNFIRLVIEKPFGRNLAGSKILNDKLHKAFEEKQLFRIDHYMGKENVQNLLALRFANAVFEPIWNRRYVDNVQITVSESLGVEHRGGFYETEGALRDIVQNHVMQVLALTLMEPPASVQADSIRDEKVKLLHSVEIMEAQKVNDLVVRGQYASGKIDSQDVVGYRDEPGVDPTSTTETFVAMQLEVDNWRWAGVPIYVRTGKRLPSRVTEVAMQFQRVPHLSFSKDLSKDLQPDVLVFRIQPDEGISLRFGVKVPGPTFKLQSVSMDFSYSDVFKDPPRDAYERLILDALIGDATLFIREDEVTQAWKIVAPIQESWENNSSPLCYYPSGTFGPEESSQLLSKSGRQWHLR